MDMIIEFEKPVREGDSLKAYCPVIKIESEESLRDLELKIVNIVSQKSLEWFKRHFTPEEISGKYSSKLFESGICIKGLLIHKSKFELDTFVEKSFFDHENVPESITEILTESADTFEECKETECKEAEQCETNMTNGIEKSEENDKSEEVEHNDTEGNELTDAPEVIHYSIDSYIDTLVNNKWIKARIMMLNNDGTYKIMFGNGLTMDNVHGNSLRENKKKNYAQAIKQVKDDLKESIEIKDYEKAYKLSKILSQLTR
jgi:hypothetical protein